MTMITTEVTKAMNESTSNLMRRFTRRVRSSGILQKVRGLRFYQRSDSSLRLKRRALRNIERREEIKRLKKLGKIRD
jgi:ribosomal protein S21